MKLGRSSMNKAINYTTPTGVPRNLHKRLFNIDRVIERNIHRKRTGQEVKDSDLALNPVTNFLKLE
jgi:hypothetical protein